MADARPEHKSVQISTDISDPQPSPAEPISAPAIEPFKPFPVRATQDSFYEDPMYLQHKAGDLFLIVETPDGDWWQGTRQGWEHRKYVQANLCNKVSFVKAIRGCEPEYNHGLWWYCGDLIQPLEPADGEWWKGQIGSEVGLFPLAFTEHYEGEPLPKGPKPKGFFSRLRSSLGIVEVRTERVGDNHGSI